VSGAPEDLSERAHVGGKAMAAIFFGRGIVLAAAVGFFFGPSVWEQDSWLLGRVSPKSGPGGAGYAIV
jgi:hypothetical protein